MRTLTADWFVWMNAGCSPPGRRGRQRERVIPSQLNCQHLLTSCNRVYAPKRPYLVRVLGSSSLLPASSWAAAAWLPSCCPFPGSQTCPFPARSSPTSSSANYHSACLMPFFGFWWACPHFSKAPFFGAMFAAIFYLFAQANLSQAETFVSH